MKYTTAKLSLAMSLRENMDKETFENEFDSDGAKVFNYLFWGDKNCNPLKNEIKLLEEKSMYDEKE